MFLHFCNSKLFDVFLQSFSVQKGNISGNFISHCTCSILVGVQRTDYFDESVIPR